ncbi:MAG: tetratricopeptide repeat protein [Bacteroidales bacterium]|nr:tetratricopeptide repeat protein [Bacteroidales bacterium]
MWRTAILFLLLVLIAGDSFSSGADDYFLKGNKAYAESNFEEAIENYLEILKQEQESSELYYNLGNAYYKMQAYPQSILYYERALKFDPLNKKIRTNLEFAQKGAGITMQANSGSSLRQWVHAINGLVNSNTWSIISIVVFILALGAFLMFFLSMRISLKRTGFYAGIVLVLISLAAFLMAGNTKKNITSSETAIVMQKNVIVKAAPNSTSKNVMQLVGGMKVYLQDEVEEWYQIEVSDGDQGWVKKSDIEVI